MYHLKTILTVGSLAILSTFSSVHANSPQFEMKDYLGFWKTEAKGEETKTATVELMPCQGEATNICGKIVALEEPLDPETSLPKKDKNNKKAALRDRPIIGLAMVSDLKPKTKGGYSKGEIYSPKTGKTYRASMMLKTIDVLELTGHVFVFSKTQTWKRTTAPMSQAK